MPRAPKAAAWLAALAICSTGAGAAFIDASPPKVEAASYVLMDALTGEVMASHEPDARRPPASLVKMMTTYVVFAAIRDGLVSQDDETVVSNRARGATGSRMFIEAGDTVSVGDLLQGLVVQSGNDAAIALAEHIAGSEEAFVELMNETAAALGMTNTSFANSTGLPADGQESTALDLAVLSRALVRDFPRMYEIHSVREYEYNGILQHNRNRLLREYRGADGIKTGYTRAAGYCLSASAVRHGMRLVGVLMGSRSAGRRSREMEALFNFGFSNYRSVELFNPGEALDEVRVWGGEANSVQVGYGDDEPLRMLLSRSDANQLRAVLENSGRQVEAPVSRGDEIATIRLSAGDKVIATVPAVALADVGHGPWWQRLTDYVRLHWAAPETAW